MYLQKSLTFGGAYLLCKKGGNNKQSITPFE